MGSQTLSLLDMCFPFQHVSFCRGMSALDFSQSSRELILYCVQDWFLQSQSLWKVDPLLTVDLSDHIIQLHSEKLSVAWSLSLLSLLLLYISTFACDVTTSTSTTIFQWCPPLCRSLRRTGLDCWSIVKKQWEPLEEILNNPFEFAHVKQLELQVYDAFWTS